jgi:hypothetical protein
MSANWYYTRLHSNENIWFEGGPLGDIDSATIDRLVEARFTVGISSTGQAVFVDRTGKDVALWITVAPEKTSQGKEAMELWRANKERREAEAARQREEITRTLNALTPDEALRRLKTK